MESVPLEQVEALKVSAALSLLEDPKAYLTKVYCLVLAVFGEEDMLQPTAQSAPMYEQYLTEAGNSNFEIMVIPGVGHSFGIRLPAYGDALAEWLDRLYAE
jgi:pimeloyl-ACP methyl ester carboxylesterase